MSDAARTHAGDLVLLIDAKNKPFLLRLEPGGELQSHRGVLRHDDLIDLPWGSRTTTHLGQAFYLLSPSLHDILLYLRRRSQIIFPKDLGYILLRLSVRQGARVIEAGTGSGALTLALAWAVGPQGRVFSYDRRADMQALARQNLESIGLAERVSFHEQPVEDGFLQTDADALFLDLPDAHLALPAVRAALRPGAPLGAIVPTTNQVSSLLVALEENSFAFIDVCEILLRFYKTVPQRVRPVDRMVAHTGYLIFARPLAAETPPPGEPADGLDPGD